jgi:hypothetical protein
MELRNMALVAVTLLSAAATGVDTASAHSGSDIPPATTRSAFPGATTNGALGTKFGDSYSPTNGTRGGGMATAGGMKAGGLDRLSRIPGTYP